MVRRFARLLGKRSTAVQTERGSALIEFGLVFPLFLTLTLGIVEFGRAVWTYSTLAYASREAVRYAVVRGATSGRAASEDQIRDVVRARVTGLDPEDVEIATTWTPDNEPGSTVQVTVVHEFHPIIPAGMAFEFEATSQMVISY